MLTTPSLPATQVSVAAMAAVLVTNKPVSSALRWKADQPVVIHLLNRLLKNIDISSLGQVVNKTIFHLLLLDRLPTGTKFQLLSRFFGQVFYRASFMTNSRESGKRHPIKYQTSPFFYLHTINAYEDDSHIVLDICCYARFKLSVLRFSSHNSVLARPC